MKRTKGLAWLSAVVMTVVMAGCGTGTGKQSATPAPAPDKQAPAQAQAPASIKIGAVVPLTGKYGSGGVQVKQGYELAVDQINAAGGVMVKEFGKKIPLELASLDDESDPTKTVARMETLNDQQKVVAYLGGFGSDLHAAAAAIAEKNKVPYLGVSFGLESIHHKGYKYLFSPFPKSTANAMIFDVFKELLPADKQPKTVAIFQEKTDWGIESAALWKSQAESHGAKVVVNEEYTPGAKDFSDLISKAKSAGAEVLLAVPSPPDGITIAKQIKELNYQPKAVLFVRAPDAPTWGSTLKDVGDNYIFAPGWYYTAKLPGVDKLDEAFQKKYNKAPDPGVGPAYACVTILADAIERAGKLDKDAIRDALTKTDLDTVVGHIKFDQFGIGSAQPFFNQWQSGQVKMIWPKESPLIYPAVK